VPTQNTFHAANVTMAQRLKMHVCKTCETA